MKEKIVVAVDASDVSEKGRSGRIYRLHYALDIFKMGSVDYSITDVKVGESLVNFKLRAGYLVIGDRAYSTIKGIEHCEKNGAEFILRMRKNSFTVRNDQGEPIDILETIQGSGNEKYADMRAFATNSGWRQSTGKNLCKKERSGGNYLNSKKAKAQGKQKAG